MWLMWSVRKSHVHTSCAASSSLLQPDPIFMTDLPVRTIITARQQSCRKECFQSLLASLLIWRHPLGLDQRKHVQTCLLGKVGSWPSTERLSWVCFSVTQVESNKSCDHCPFTFCC